MLIDLAGAWLLRMEQGEVCHDSKPCCVVLLKLETPMTAYQILAVGPDGKAMHLALLTLRCGRCEPD